MGQQRVDRAIADVGDIAAAIGVAGSPAHPQRRGGKGGRRVDQRDHAEGMAASQAAELAARRRADLHIDPQAGQAIAQGDDIV